MRVHKRNKNLGQTENKQQLIDINLTISIIIVRANWLNTLIKRQRLPGCIKNIIYYMTLELHFSKLTISEMRKVTLLEISQILK